MGTYDREINALVAMAKVVGTDATVLSNRGFASITRTSPGVYLLVREEGATGADLGTDEVFAHVTSNASQMRVAQSQDYDDASTIVTTYDAAGSAADSDFTLSVWRTTNHE